VAIAVEAPGGVGGFLRGALFHYVRLLGNGRRALREVAAALGATPDERVLDVGCGSGWCCHAVPGEYVGIDLDPDYLAFARWRWRSSRRAFRLVEVAGLDPEERFDKAFMVNFLHHLSDAQADQVLGRLARLVRRRLIVVDADPDASNRFQAFLLAHDRGNFIRTAPAQRALIERHFAIVQDRRFRTTTGTVLQALFVCTPR
jgi:SAM-dependent methyltransferase